MTDFIILLTLLAFMLLAVMTLECVWRYGYASAWAVFAWCLTIGFAWLLIGDVLAKAWDYAALAQPPLRSGVFRSLVCLGALQWLFRQGGQAHG